MSERQGDGMKEHDYTKRGFGHDVVIRLAEPSGLRLNLTGWGPGLVSGDSIILPQKGGGSSRYRLVKVLYERDPPDMWNAEAEFFPRSELRAAGRPEAYSEAEVLAKGDLD